MSNVLPDRQWTGPRKAPVWRGTALLLLALGALLIGWHFAWPQTGQSADMTEQVSGRFTICGQGRSANCVIDGDTFKLGPRRIRILDIDAPETHPARCPAEAALGARATRQLQHWLNQGPFEMAGYSARAMDRYGRELRELHRVDRFGRRISLVEAMMETGAVRRYDGGRRASWCDAAP